MANRAVIVEELPASARLMATREIMLATGKDLESVRLILLQLPATVATDLNQEQADKLQQALAVLGARVTLK
jgi:ribosomal protein L7/L12